jgi:flagellar hook protein FlgE
MMQIPRSGIAAASRDLSVVSNNLANALTTGFKKSHAMFTDVVSEGTGTGPGVGSQNGTMLNEVTRNMSQGAIASTGSSLDLALTGGGFFTFGDPKASGGDPIYTYSRSGKMNMDSSGAITDTSGAPLMGLSVSSNGVVGSTPQPINLISAAKGNLTNIQSISIDANGVINLQLTDGSQSKAGAVALAGFRNEQGLTAASGSKWQETENSGPPEFSGANRNGLGKINQGSLEDSNVDMTGEMLHMISAQQSYNGNARALQTSSEMLRSAIETLAHG